MTARFSVSWAPRNMRVHGHSSARLYLRKMRFRRYASAFSSQVTALVEPMPPPQRLSAETRYEYIQFHSPHNGTDDIIGFRRHRPQERSVVLVIARQR